MPSPSRSLAVKAREMGYSSAVDSEGCDWPFAKEGFVSFLARFVALSNLSGKTSETSRFVSVRHQIRL